MNTTSKTEIIPPLTPLQVSHALLQQWQQAGSDGALEVLTESRYWHWLARDIEEQGLTQALKEASPSTQPGPLTPLEVAQGLVQIWKISSKPTMERLMILEEAREWFRMACEIAGKRA